MDKIWIDGVLHIADEEVIAKLNRLALELDRTRSRLGEVMQLLADVEAGALANYRLALAARRTRSRAD